MLPSQATTKKFDEEGVDDLVLLPKVTNQGIMQNLEKRYRRNLIYTNIGPVLVSVNPFKYIKGVCDAEQVDDYKGRFRYEVPPNIFALAEDAYRTMKNQNENQCIIITATTYNNRGESGAGKTEAAKLIMKYVAAVSGSAQDIAYVKDIIMESNPLLEAFGNAKTLRNNNSSRFGKYFEIQFNRVGDPCGGVIRHYLLEKSRVVGRLSGERSFHIFYQLLAGASQEEKTRLALGTPEQFRFLNMSNCSKVDGMDDAEEFKLTRHAMNTLQFTQDEQWAILKIIAGILHLGNIEFGQDTQDKATYKPGSETALQSGAVLLDISVDVLKQAFAFRTIHSRNSTYSVPNNALQATGARDALCKVVYSRVFDFLIEKTNTALQRYAAQSSCVIGVLDIYGFEIFSKNGFEQFCINYVNEKLQQFFIELTIKAEQEEYNKEGIKWEPINYFNNKIVCDLIEGKNPPGIFSVLDDVCTTMHAVGNEGGIDLKFLDKNAQYIVDNKHYWRKGDSFVVKHYAGEVVYHSDQFAEKNRDHIYPDLIQALQSSQSRFLVSRFPEDVSDKQQKRAPSAGFVIRNSAGELMKTLSACTPHYVRCIKPNETKQAQEWDEKRVEHQVQYLGLLENVRVRRAGFAFRAPFDRFLQRYKKLNPQTWSRTGEWNGPAKQGCQVILQGTPLGDKQWQLGVNKVFIRHPESLFFLEESLERADYDAAMIIQKAYRKLVASKQALEQRSRAANIMLGKKDRRNESPDRKFDTDYMRYDQNYGLQNALGGNKDERVVFADQVTKLNNRLRCERRDFILSVEAIYLVMRAFKVGQQFYKLSLRVPITTLTGVSLSTLKDNFVVFHTTKHDFVVENDKKTEMITVLNDYFTRITGRGLPINFTDSITYKTSVGDTRTLNMVQDPNCQKARLKKSNKSLTIFIAPGLGKAYDTTPKMFNRPTNPQSNTGARAQTTSTPVQQVVQQQQAQVAKPQPTVPKPQPTLPPVVKQNTAVAQFPFAGGSATELSFNQGDIVIIHRKDPGGWWEGELNGKVGWIPSNYVKEL